MADTTPNPQNLMVSYMLAQNPNTALQFQRQQALAQALSENSDQEMAPNTLANPGGYVVNQNPMIMAGKALEKGISGYLQGKNAKMLADALKGNNPAANVAAMNSNGGGPTQQNLALAKGMMGQGGTPSADVNPMAPITGNVMQDAYIRQINPTAYEEKVKAIYANAALTTEQKNAAAAQNSNNPYLTGPMHKSATTPFTINGKTDVPYDFITNSTPPMPGGGNAVPMPHNIVANPAQTQGYTGNPNQDAQSALNPTDASATPVNQQASANGTNLTPSGALPGTEQVSVPSQTVASTPAQTITGFGKPLGSEMEANKNSENLSEANKLYNVGVSNLPRALERFQEIRAAAPDASYGYGVDETGEGHAVDFAQSSVGHAIEPKTARANQIINTAAKQGIITELGPQLAGMRPNKFLESIATGASGLKASDPPDVKVNNINMLEDQYIGSIKAAAAQRRAYGDTSAPTDADIDRMVMQSYPSKTINGVKYYNVRGVWHQE